MKCPVLFSWILAGSIAALAIPASAQTLIERTQLRRTADPSERNGATGTITRRVYANGKEIFEVQIKGLGEDQYAIYGTDTCANFDTNCYVDAVTLVNRTSVKKGVWTRKIVGINVAPAEFVSLGITNLADILIGQLDVAQPHIPDIVTSVTNIVGGVTNIVGSVTNIVGSTTNVVLGIPLPTINQTGEVFATLWAPLRPMTTKPNLLSYSAITNLFVPDVIAPPSPNATGKVKTHFVGSQGRSIIEVHAKGLIQGQKYTLFIADQMTNLDEIVMIPAGDMTTNKAGNEADFVRDTKFADPLPQQAGNIEELTGRRIEVRDSFFNVHLEGTIPGPATQPEPDLVQPTVSF